MGGTLEGIKVLDVTRVMSGPYCTMLLGDMGAEINKVEPPSGDDSRKMGPPFISGESAYFLSVNRNKKSIVIDLKKEKGREILYRLARESDVFVENFRPGTTAELGIDYVKLKSLNDKLIYCSISGFGQYGPYRDRPGYDLVALAMGGLMGITGEADRPPVKLGVPISDIVSGIYAAFAITAALHARNETGLGQFLDVSMLDCQIACLTHQAGYYFATGKNPERLGSAHPSIVPYQAFKASDGDFIVAVANDSQWKSLCRALGLDNLVDSDEFRTNADRVRNREKLVAILEKLFSSRPVSRWITMLIDEGVPSAPILTLQEILDDPHVHQREMISVIKHPKIGEIRTTGVAVKFSETPGSIRQHPPTLGEQTDKILSEIGYSYDEISALREESVVH